MLASFSSEAFVLGLQDAVAAVVIGAAVAWVWRRVVGRPAPVAGLLLVLAAGLSLSRVPHLIAPYARRLSPLASLPRGLAMGIALLAAAGFVAEFLPARGAIAAVTAVPGAWIIATQAGLPDIGWIRVVTAVVIVAGGASLAGFDRRWREGGFAVVMVAVSAAGVYMTVPETTQASVLLASAGPLVVLAWPRPVVSLGAPGAFATAGLIAWTVAAGGLARHPSILGGLACLGLLVVEPLARALDGGRASVLDLVPRQWRMLAAIVGQLALVGVAARVVGRLSSVAISAIGGFCVLAGAVAVSVGAVRIARRLGPSEMPQRAEPRGRPTRRSA